MKIFAPAKVNIGLEVFPVRDDGFHPIRSIFTTVNLCDELEVQVLSEKNTCLVRCEGMELPEENTLTKAYKAFCVLTGVDSGVCVDIKKHIPSGGGLGGGSSDASSFIQSLDCLFSTHLEASSLRTIAGNVGSDVFFFTEALIDSGIGFSGSYAAVVEGRGEKVRKINARTDLAMVLLFPEVHVSTGEAYGLMDREFASGALPDKKADFVMEEEYMKDVSVWRFFNSFTIPVSNKFPRIMKALFDMKDSGALFSDMSGSGSTVFGVFASKREAEAAEKKLSKTWKTVSV